MSRQLLVNLSFLSAQPTGISNYALKLLPALQSLSPRLFSPTQIPGYDLADHQFTSPEMSSDCGRKGHLKRLLWLQFKAPQHLRKFGDNLLFTPLPEAPLFTNCRYVATAHDIIPLRFPSASPIPLLHLYFKYVVPQVLQQAEHIICNSETTAADITAAYGIAAKRMTPIYLGYDESLFRPLGLPTEPYFLYVGRHSPHKNLLRLIQAFSQIRDPAIQLWLAGLPNRTYTPQLVNCIESLELRDRVRFLGYVADADLPALIGQALAFVFPSLWEGFGLPILEAMACGTPVISSNCASMAEVAGDAALLIDPHVTEDLAHTMQRLVQEVSLHQHLRDRGLARVKHFSWQRAGFETAAILRQYS